jgi:electron transport complex protein RnfC
MTRTLHRFSGGLHLDTHKHESRDVPSMLVPLPGQIILPLKQHIGLAARPLVNPGERVLKGQIIAEPEGYVSVPVHATTSGVVRDIGDYHIPHPFGIREPCIVIDADGLDELFPIEAVTDYAALTPQALQEIIRDRGIAGLGGAGFPAHVKLKEGVDNAVDTLIINGVECEPYITCDDRLIREKAMYVVSGARMIRHAVNAKHCVIAVEEDMPEAHDALAGHITAHDDIELVRVPTRYPAGGEKQLIQVLTGKEVPSGGFSINIGIIVHNVATAAAVYRAVTRGEPLISRYVTVTGEVKTPRNLQVLLGTPVSDCNIPVTKTTNCIIVRRKIPPIQELPCIRCGRCADVCPVNLLPQQLYLYAKADRFDETRQHHLFDCIECGCCSCVCPSHIPLVQYYRYAKFEIALEEQRRQGATRAEQRFLNRKRRLQQRQEVKQKQKAGSTTTATESGDTDADRKAFVRAAVARTRSRKERGTDR